MYSLSSRNTIRTGRYVFFLFSRRRRRRRSFRLGTRRRLIPNRHRQNFVVRIDTSLHSSFVNVVRGTRGRVYQVPPNRVDLEETAARERNLLREIIRLERRQLELW